MSTFSTSERPKVALIRQFFTLLTWKCASRHNGVHFFDISTSKSGLRPWCVLYILTWKCASGHNGVHFFDISTSKSGPNVRCLYLFYLQMCFAPQHLNFQKWSEPGVLCAFWLGNVLCATTACTFSTSQLPKVVCDRGVFCAFWLRNLFRATTACNFSSLIWPAGSAPAALARFLFDPAEPQIIGKKQWVATFPPFSAPASSCFSLFLFSDLLTSWLLLPDSSHLCFSISASGRKFDF